MNKGEGQETGGPRLVRKRRSGQSTVEYFLIISVIVMAFYWLLMEEDTVSKPLKDGMGAMQEDVGTWIEDGVVGGGGGG